MSSCHAASSDVNHVATIFLLMLLRRILGGKSIVKYELVITFMVLLTLVGLHVHAERKMSQSK